MKKFIYMVDFEFKRNLKYYIGFIITMCSILFINLVINLKNYNEIIKEKTNLRTLENIYDISGGFNFSNLISDATRIIFVVGLILCLAYSLVIWMRDFRGKNKSIYTLLMIPNQRIKIYFSKYLNILAFIYMYIMSFLLTLFIAYNILPKFMLGNKTSFGFVRETIYELGIIIPYNFVDFVCIYIFLMTASIFTIFTLILKNKSLTKAKKILMNIICIPGFIIIFYASVLGALLSPSPSFILVIYTLAIIFACLKASKKLLSNSIDF